MSFQPYKFQVLAVVQEVDEHGNVVGEATVAETTAQGQQAFTVYGGVDGLIEWAKNFPDNLAETPPPQGA